MVSDISGRILKIADEHPTVKSVVIHTRTRGIYWCVVWYLNAEVCFSGPLPPVRWGGTRFSRLVTDHFGNASTLFQGQTARHSSATEKMFLPEIRTDHEEQQKASLPETRMDQGERGFISNVIIANPTGQMSPSPNSSPWGVCPRPNRRLSNLHRQSPNHSPHSSPISPDSPLLEFADRKPTTQSPPSSQTPTLQTSSSSTTNHELKKARPAFFSEIIIFSFFSKCIFFSWFKCDLMLL